MVQMRAVGLLALLLVVPAVAESVSVELTPQGMLALQLTAADRAMSESLGAALGRSLGCRLSDVAESQSGGQWVFRAGCSGVFQRRGQVLEGQLKFAGFRQALTKASIDEIEVDVGVPSAPYSRGKFPRAWNEICSNGVIHHTSVVEPRALPARAIHVAVGYRSAELALIFAPLPFTLLLALMLLAWLNITAAKAPQMDPRALWFCYRRSVAWGLTGLFLLWAAMWAAISGAFAGDADVWALYRVWNGGSAVSGKMLASVFYMSPALLSAVLCVWWRPKAFAGLCNPQSRFLDTMKMYLLPALALIVPACWTISAFGALVGGELAHVFSRIWIAVMAAMFLRFALRHGRAQRAWTLESGEVYDRLQALAARCGVALKEIQVAPIREALVAEPVEAEGERVALSEYALETLEPAEVEAEVARRWSLPLRKYTGLRQVLLFFLALCTGAVLSLAIVLVLGGLLLLLRIHASTAQAALARLSMPMAVVWAVVVGRWIHGGLMRRADRRAAVLVGSPEVVTRAAEKVAAMEMPPWKWGRASGGPAASAEASAVASAVAILAAGDERRSAAPRIFCSSWRSMVSNVKAEATVLALSIPPVAVALAVRAGRIPTAARWPAYLAAMALALLLRSTLSKLMDCWSYRRLRSKIGARMQVAEREGVMFIGLSPEPRALVYDRNWDWDAGFLTLSGDCLDYQGEQARFTLRREQVSEIHVGTGAPHWSDPHWIYLSWRDSGSGREGTIPLILPRVCSPWRHSALVGELDRKLQAWKSGAAQTSAGTERPDWGLPVFPAGAGASYPNQLPGMATVIVLSGLGFSLLAHFPIMSEATLCFALVWTANVLWDLFGHRFAALPETAAA